MATRSPRTETRDARAKRDPNAVKKADREVVKKAERQERVPLGVPRAKLKVPQRPGYKRRWINDDDKGRLQAALEGGYSHVVDPNLRVGEDGGGSRTDSRVSRIVGRGEGSKPLRAYLMEIPSELYKRDQASKQSALDEVDRAIRKGRVVSQGEEHRYIPDGGKAIRVQKETTRAAPADEDDPNAE
jgi:hypothetical protein